MGLEVKIICKWGPRRLKIIAQLGFNFLLVCAVLDLISIACAVLYAALLAPLGPRHPTPQGPPAAAF